MNTFLNDSLLATLAAALLGVVVLVRNPRHPQNLSFAGFLFSAAALCFGSLTIYYAPDMVHAYRWGLVTRWALMFMPACFITFCLHFADIDRRVRRPVQAGAFAISGVLAVLSFTPWMVTGFAPHGRYIKPTFGPAYPVFIAVLIAAFLAGVGVLLWSFRERDAYERNRVKLFIGSMSLGLTVGCAGYFLLHRMEYPLMAPAVLCSTPLMAFAFLRHRLLDVTSYMRLGLSYLLMLVMVLPLFAVLLLVQLHAYGESDATVAVVTGGVLVVLAFFFPGVREWLPRSLRNAIQVDATGLAEALRGIVGQGTVTAVAQRLTSALVSHTSAVFVWVYVSDGQQPGFRLAGCFSDASRAPGSLGLSKPGIAWLMNRERSTLLQDLAPERGFYSGNGRDVRLWMVEHGVEVAVPVEPRRGMAALVLLGRPHNGGIYGTWDVESLDVFATSASVALAAARLFEDQQSDQQIQAVTETVAALSHELRNSLIPARTFLELLPRRLDDEEFLGAYRELALQQMLRSFEILKNFRDLNLVGDLDLSTRALDDVLCDCVVSLAPVAEQHGTRIEVGACPAGVLARFDGALVRQALVNLLMNALQHAAGEPVRVDLSVDTSPIVGMSQARVVVTNAAFIPADRLQRVFLPFYSSRPRGERGGTGLGLPIALRIARAHGGVLSMNSSEYGGTVVTFSLPVDPPPRHEDAQPERSEDPQGKQLSLRWGNAS